MPDAKVLLQFLLPFTLLWGAPSEVSAGPLPYATRSRGYDGGSTSARGDIRTVGMGGSTVGLADTFLAALDNPAGLAMTLGPGDLHYTGNTIRDGYVQDESLERSLGSYGAAINLYPWGASLGYRSTYREGTGDTNVQVYEWQASVARLFSENRLSVGLGLIFGVSDQTISPDSSHSATVGAVLGVMYQLPRHFLLGGSFRPAMRYTQVTPSTTEPAQLPGFFQPLEVPSKVEVGVSWIPNRFAEVAFGVALMGTTTNSGLLRDESIRAGTAITAQPKLGASYVFAEFKNIKGSLFAGSYFESTRIEGAYNRIHMTGGVEAKLWFVTAGYGVDRSAHYRNQMISVGIDPFRIMEMLEIIPKPWQPPQGGWFANPFHLSDEGLPRPLVKDWKPRGPDMNPIKVGLDIPERIKEKIEQITAPTTVPAVKKKAEKKPLKSKSTR